MATAAVADPEDMEKEDEEDGEMSAGGQVVAERHGARGAGGGGADAAARPKEKKGKKALGELPAEPHPPERPQAGGHAPSASTSGSGPTLARKRSSRGATGPGGLEEPLAARPRSARRSPPRGNLSCREAGSGKPARTAHRSSASPKASAAPTSPSEEASTAAQTASTASRAQRAVGVPRRSMAHAHPQAGPLPQSHPDGSARDARSPSSFALKQSAPKPCHLARSGADDGQRVAHRRPTPRRRAGHAQHPRHAIVDIRRGAGGRTAPVERKSSSSSSSSSNRRRRCERQEQHGPKHQETRCARI